MLPWCEIPFSHIATAKALRQAVDSNQTCRYGERGGTRDLPPARCQPLGLLMVWMTIPETENSLHGSFAK